MEAAVGQALGPGQGTPLYFGLNNLRALPLPWSLRPAPPVPVLWTHAGA